jgi:hypothetical protein
MIQGLGKELDEATLRNTDLQDYGALDKIADEKARAAVLRAQMNAEMKGILSGLASAVQVGSGTAAFGLRLIQLQRETDANRAI